MMMGIGADPIWGRDSDYWGPGIHIFSAAWCGHCQAMKRGNKKFQSAMTRKRNDPSPHTLIQTSGTGVKVWSHELTSDEEKAKAVEEKFVYSGFPTIIFKFRSGRVQDYNGPRIISKDDAEVIEDGEGNAVYPPRVDMLIAYSAAAVEDEKA
jgi:glutaredoxin